MCACFRNFMGRVVRGAKCRGASCRGASCPGASCPGASCLGASGPGTVNTHCQLKELGSTGRITVCCLILSLHNTTTQGFSPNLGIIFIRQELQLFTFLASYELHLAFATSLLKTQSSITHYRLNKRTSIFRFPFVEQTCEILTWPISPNYHFKFQRRKTQEGKRKEKL